MITNIFQDTILTTVTLKAHAENVSVYGVLSLDMFKYDPEFVRNPIKIKNNSFQIIGDNQ